MRSLVATACALFALSLSGVARAEPTTIEAIDTWCNVAELRPADVDFDRGLRLIGAADVRLGAIHGELDPLVTAMRGLHAERNALTKAIDSLREERAVRANRENDSTRDVDAKIAKARARIETIDRDLLLVESKASALSAEARRLFDHALRLGRDADDIAASANADAGKKKKGAQIAEKTRRILRWHFAITKTLSGQ